MERLADRWALWFLLVTLAARRRRMVADRRCGAGAGGHGGGDAVPADPGGAGRADLRHFPRGASGIIIKGGGALERLARVRTVLFDKTGTLTTGTPRVSGIEPLPGFEADDLLRLAARWIRRRSMWWRARSWPPHAAGLPLALPQEVVEIPGGGLAGMVDGVASWWAAPACWSRRRSATRGSAARLAAAAHPLPGSPSTASRRCAAAGRPHPHRDPARHPRVARGRHRAARHGLRRSADLSRGGGRRSGSMRCMPS